MFLKYLNISIEVAIIKNLPIFFFAFLILVLSGCGKYKNEPVTYGLFTKNITVDGVSRRYAIYVPENLGTSPVPLIFELHGGGVYIEDMTGESGHKSPYKLWMNLADLQKFIVVRCIQ